MLEQAVVQQKSKTQELRNWLDGEIKRLEGDVLMLNMALTVINGKHSGGRYYNLLSDEREVKMGEDRKKLEKLQKRLELLSSAQKLYVDIDFLERLGVVVPRVHSYQEEAILEGSFGGPEDRRGFKFRFDMGRRIVHLEVKATQDYVVSEHYIEGITGFAIKHGRTLCWSHAVGGKDYELSVGVYSKSGIYLQPGIYLSVRYVPL